MSKNTKHSNLAIVIFPYLFIHDKEGLNIDDILIKPSYTEVIDSESKEIKKHLLRIAKLFRFGRNNQIFQWSYFTFNINNLNTWINTEKKIRKFINLLRYSQLKDLKDHARFGQFNYFLFEITRQQLNKDDNDFYYSGILDGESNYNFQCRDGLVSNPYIPVEEFYPLFITKSQLNENKYFNILYGFKREVFRDDEDLKIIRSIEWFNRSFSHYGRGVDLSEAIINVHTALEALLRPSDEERSVKAQLKTSISNLLGHSRELSEWIDSFWKLRNSIVHGDTETGTFLYIHSQSKKKKGHRHHLNIARKVYVKCLDAILKVRLDFPLIGFEEELISNEVKVNKSIKLLSKRKSSLQKYYVAGVFDIISSLRADDVSSGREETKKLGEILLAILKSNIDNKDLIEKIDEIINWKSPDLGGLAIKYSELENLFSPTYFGASPSKVELLALYGAVYNFLGFATWRLLTFYD